MKSKFDNLKNNYPKMDDNLKNRIINKYEVNKSVKRFPKWAIILTSSLSAAMVTGIVISAAISIPNGSYKSDAALTSGHTSTLESASYSKAETLDKKGKDIDISESFKDSEIDPTSSDKDSKIQSSTLTGSAYNDNEYYDFYRSLLTYQSDQSKGIYQEYYEQIDNFKIADRIKLTFPKGLDGKVSMYDDKQNLIYQSMIDNAGYCYLFSNVDLETYSLSIEYLDDNNVKTYTDTVSENKSYVDLDEFKNAINHPSNILEVMFVIDTTGSMGDELDYLKEETKSIINRVSNANKDATIYTSALVYRDVGDEYVTKFSDFSSNIDVTNRFINNQSYDGGGDFEESVAEAFKTAYNASWTSSYSTKLIIHVADAPDHSYNYEKWEEYTHLFASKGISIITLACSGIDTLTEYLFRNQSMLTNGTYCYLTDDSGIGESHLTPKMEITPEVEYVNAMLVRLINGYFTGSFENPVSYYEKNI